MSVILGIDPGSRITGFGIVRAERHQVDYIECGCIRLGSGELDQRLRYLHEQLSAIIEQFHPAEVAIERVFMNRNADSALKLGHARGVAIVAASLNGAEVSEYSATQIKQTVVGRGHADKQQVQHMVSALLKLEKTPQSDAADALATALCHAHMREGLARLAFAGRRT